MSSERASAAVTISEEERRRLAAFKNILGGSSSSNGANGANPEHQAAAAESLQKQQEHYSDEDEDEDENLARQARAAWAQATPEKKVEKDEIWTNGDKTSPSQENNNNNSAKKAPRSSSPGASPEGKTANVAVFSAQTTTAGWSNQNSTADTNATVNVISPVRKAKPAAGDAATPEVHKPNIASRKSGTSPIQQQEAEQKVPADVKLSVKARPFVPKHQTIEKTFSPDQQSGSVSAGDADASASTSTGQSRVGAGGRRAPVNATTSAQIQQEQPEGAVKGRGPGSALASNNTDFMRWMGGAYRGPLQDPAMALSSGFPLWMHLAVLPEQCGNPSAKRVLRAWAIQFGLESVEYWTWRRMVIRGVRVPVDCSEPDVLSHQPVAEYLKGVLKWYDRLGNYKNLKILTEEEKSLTERLATRSREEFMKYIKAYTPSAKAAFELMEKELKALEEEAMKVEAARAKNSRVLGAGLTSAVNK